MVPEQLKYTKEHEWIKIDGDEATVGITDYAQTELGDITFVELPDVGKEVKQSDSVATVESVKAASDVYSPLSGKILAVNEALQSAPEGINSSPYEDGWIYRLSISNSGELDTLMAASEYEKLLGEENQ